ncbi:hypothetical protein D9Q98_005920 [Chlorella vulgaris]|uniref:Thioredoxin domain-containing protein n=1 Tax=Chlorella vulgaris TaxID=3077 RepID=A0A9D4TWN2_CHLVU|nr:hypothetical protein D9Q98_005920 [Chlorella vulgaris]
MAQGLLPRLLAALAVLVVGAAAAKSHGRPSSVGATVVTLTDLNFDEMMGNGRPWMINVFSHYCQLTYELEAAFEKLAKPLANLASPVSVGRIDGSSERGLMSRFQLRGYHAVFHINGTETRQYCDGHNCEGQRLAQRQLLKFAREGWKAVEPRTGCSSPVSKCGRAVGQITKLPAQMKSSYAYLHNERQYSDLTLFAGILAVPVAIGLSLICMLDAYYSRRLPAQPHLHIQ